MKKIHLVLSAPQMFGFMRGQGERLRHLGYRVAVLSSKSDLLDAQAKEDGIDRLTIPIVRDIAPQQDLATLVSLCRVLIQDRPDAVMLSGPKAIFLGGIAAWITGVNRRIAIYHGMRQEASRGLFRVILDFCDRVSFASADKVLVVSPSLGRLIVARGLVPAHKVTVTGNGTANGIDCYRFDRTREVHATADAIRTKLCISPDAPVLGFVGRITEDKGMGHLLDVLNMVRSEFPKAVLLAVGPDELRTPNLRNRWQAACSVAEVLWVGGVNDVRPYLCLMNVHVFPSLREGFGLSVAEAAAMQVPSVGFRTTGVVDAIINGETGALVQSGDSRAMAAEVLCYLRDPAKRAADGVRARARTTKDFSPEHTWSAYQAALLPD